MSSEYSTKQHTSAQLSSEQTSKIWYKKFAHFCDIVILVLGYFSGSPCSLVSFMCTHWHWFSNYSSDCWYHPSSYVCIYVHLLCVYYYYYYYYYYYKRQIYPAVSEASRTGLYLCVRFYNRIDEQLQAELQHHNRTFSAVSWRRWWLRGSAFDWAASERLSLVAGNEHTTQSPQHTRRAFFFLPRAKDELPTSSPLPPLPSP